MGLTLWDYSKIRSAALRQNERWVKTISTMVSGQRTSLTHWLERFPVKTSTFRDIANSRDDVAGLYLVDLKSHVSQNWTRPGLQKVFEPLDPRLGVLQLQALETQKTLTGPVIFVQGVPYFTVGRPVSRSRVLITFVDASPMWKILKDEAKIWKMKVSIYDYEKHSLFSSYQQFIPADDLEETIHRVRNKKTSTVVSLPRKLAWKWLITSHYDASADWIFIIAQPAAWVYSPILFFSSVWREHTS